jgi:hypothetical protein
VVEAIHFFVCAQQFALDEAQVHPLLPQNSFRGRTLTPRCDHDTCYRSGCER